MQFNISNFAWSFFMFPDTTYDGTSRSPDTTHLSRVVVRYPVQRYLIAHHGTCWPKRFLTVNIYKCIITNIAHLHRTIRANMANSLIAWYPVRLNGGTYSTMFSINETGLQWDSDLSVFGGWLGTSHYLLRNPFPLIRTPLTYWQKLIKPAFDSMHMVPRRAAAVLESQLQKLSLACLCAG